MDNFREKILEAFTQSTQSIQGRGRKPLQIGKVARNLGLKPNRKFLGRNRSGRNKIRSKRRNNFKTYEARKILAQRHGITNALKKEENKYVLTYGDIARLMRQNGYTYSTTIRRWLSKKERDDEKEKNSDKKKDPYVNRPKPKPSDSPETKKKKKEPTDVEDDTDSEDEEDPLDKPEPFKFEPPKKPKPEKKDRLKYLQARIVLIANGEPQYGEYEIVPDDIEFKIPDDQVKQRMMDKEFLWLKNRDKWVDYKGKDPNPLERYKGTLGRAILVFNGDYSFLDFEDGDLGLVSDSMEDLGYEYIDSDWVNTEEQEEPISEAAGTSSTPANAGPGANSQGIAPFRARLGSKVSKRKKPNRIFI